VRPESSRALCSRRCRRAEGKIEEAIRVAERKQENHLAKVVVAGLQEFKAHGDSNDIPGEQIEASQRALERAEAIVHAELKRVWVAGHIGSRSFIGLLGTVVGILNAFKEISTQKRPAWAPSPRHLEALVTTAIGLFVAIPAVMMFNYFTNKWKLRRGNGQQLQRADRLLPQASHVHL